MCFLSAHSQGWLGMKIEKSLLFIHNFEMEQANGRICVAKLAASSFSVKKNIIRLKNSAEEEVMKEQLMVENREPNKFFLVKKMQQILMSKVPNIYKEWVKLAFFYITLWKLTGNVEQSDPNHIS